MEERGKEVLLALLKQIRTEAGLTQEELAQKLGLPQSFVSKYESGERRLDILELRQVCQQARISLKDFSARLEAALGGHRCKRRQA